MLYEVITRSGQTDPRQDHGRGDTGVAPRPRRSPAGVRLRHGSAGAAVGGELRCGGAGGRLRRHAGPGPAEDRRPGSEPCADPPGGTAAGTAAARCRGLSDGADRKRARSHHPNLVREENAQELGTLV